MSGNVEFPATVEIIVQENTKANMEEMTAPTGIAQTGAADQHLQGEQRQGPAEADVQGQDDARQGRRRDRSVSTSAAATPTATPGSCSRRCASMHAGDIFSGKNIPLLDANNGGSGVEIGDTLAKAADSVKNIDTDHHRPQHDDDDGRPDGIRRSSTRTSSNDVQAAKKAGKSVDEVADSWKMPAKYTGYADTAAGAAEGQRPGDFRRAEIEDRTTDQGRLPALDRVAVLTSGARTGGDGVAAAESTA